MKDFNWTSFDRKIAVQASLQEMYDAWTKPQELERWFLSKAHYTRPDGSVVSPTEYISEGDAYQWSWHTWDILEEGRVLFTNGKDLMRFSFAGECTVEIKLKEKGEDILMSLTQSNIPTDNMSKKNIRLGCYEGWSFYMVNLKSIYEGGLDLRNMDKKYTGIINT